MKDSKNQKKASKNVIKKESYIADIIQDVSITEQNQKIWKNW